jgi:hypothetical protein
LLDLNPPAAGANRKFYGVDDKRFALRWFKDRWQFGCTVPFGRRSEMKSILLTLAIAATSTVLAIGASQNQPAGPQQGASNDAVMPSCPMKVTGADISATDVENGIALTITTKTGDVAELRRRTESMAKMHTGPANTDMHGHMMAFSLSSEEIPKGVRLTLKPNDLSQLTEFRATVRQHVDQMKKGDCSMMQGMMQGMMGGMKKADPNPKPAPKVQSDDADHSAHHPEGGKK